MAWEGKLAIKVTFDQFVSVEHALFLYIFKKHHG